MPFRNRHIFQRVNSVRKFTRGLIPRVNSEYFSPCFNTGLSNGVKLIIGFIFKEEEAFRKAKFILEKRFGQTDFESQVLPFNHTSYYREEFGEDLKKKFISLNKLIEPCNLTEIKLYTNKIERKLSKGSSRLINIDPGYIDLAKLILASTKDYKHRICLNKSVYAEVTLFYENKSYRAWEWTYPDYKTNEYIAIFNRIRNIYARQIKNKPC